MVIQAVITWEAPVQTGGTTYHYHLYRADDGGAFNLLDGDIPSGQLSYTDSTIVDTHTYIYKLCAFNTLGEGVFTAEIEITAGVPDFVTVFTDSFPLPDVPSDWTTVFSDSY
jgi:hypothetical protein